MVNLQEVLFAIDSLILHYKTYGIGAIHADKFHTRLMDNDYDAVALTESLEAENLIQSKHNQYQCALVYHFDVEKIEQKKAAIANLKRVVTTADEVQPTSDESKATKPTGGKPATVNERMAGTIMENSEAIGWNSVQWAKRLKCSRSTVTATPTWKKLESARQEEKAKRMEDRHRNLNANNQRRK